MPKKLFLLISMTTVLLICLALADPALAQSPIEIERLQVNIWPEYDRPDVLVIYHIGLAAEVDLPAQLAINIPRQSGTPYNVAMKDVDGLLYNLEYTITPADEDWITVSFVTPSPDIQLEYYDPGLQRSGTLRNFEYRWPAEYSVQSLTIQVQQPSGAQKMQISPDMGTGRLEADGFTYYTAVVGQVKAGVPLVIRFSYEKSDDSLSSKSQPVEPVEAVTAKTPGRTTFQEALPYVLGTFGILLVAAGFFWYWQSNRDPSTSIRKRHEPHDTGPLNRVSGNQVKTTTYCHQCGKLSQAGDVFCRSCGAKLRME